MAFHPFCNICRSWHKPDSQHELRDEEHEEPDPSARRIVTDPASEWLKEKRNAGIEKSG